MALFLETYNQKKKTELKNWIFSIIDIMGSASAEDKEKFGMKFQYFLRPHISFINVSWGYMVSRIS